MNRYLHFVRGVSLESLASIPPHYHLDIHSDCLTTISGGISLHKVFAVRRLSLASVTSPPEYGESLTQWGSFSQGCAKMQGSFPVLPRYSNQVQGGTFGLERAQGWKANARSRVLLG
jgi:hypothetical protein